MFFSKYTMHKKPFFIQGHKCHKIFTNSTQDDGNVLKVYLSSFIISMLFTWIIVVEILLWSVESSHYLKLRHTALYKYCSRYKTTTYVIEFFWCISKFIVCNRISPLKLFRSTLLKLFLRIYYHRKLRYSICKKVQP